MTGTNGFHTLFQEGENCHKVAVARRASCLIDGEAYYRAVYKAMQQARRSIMIVGWDLHSEIELIRERDRGSAPSKLGAYLDTLAKRRKGLNIYLLSWDFAMIYAMEREFFPRYKFKWRTHRRIHFCLDGEHPVGGSQHQKIVVVDDAVAFSGGLDLSQWRWDTSGHRSEDDRRKDPSGRPYPPFHDVQMMVDGDAAKVLGNVAKDRWLRACGEMPAFDSESEVAEDPWPADIRPDFTNVRIAVARTYPAYKEHAEVREVERLYEDSIAMARRFIYAENQYLSALRVGKALRARLEAADGPEVILVLPQKTGGWLEQHTMDVLRGRLLKELRAADRHDRLGIYYPRLAENPERTLMVHAKVMVIDDEFIRIGSSNLSNRSLGLDAECDLAVGAKAATRESETIAAIRNRLLGEHLDASEAAVAAAIGSEGSLGARRRIPSWRPANARAAC
jgi:phospholipase D1/2